MRFVINFVLRDYDALWQDMGSPDDLNRIWRDTGFYDEDATSGPCWMCGGKSCSKGVASCRTVPFAPPFPCARHVIDAPAPSPYTCPRFPCDA
jgi:hypothetical protein